MKSAILQAIARSFLLAPGVVPLGLVFGATAAGAGFSPLEATLFSAVVFAGATQFVVVAAMETGAGIAALVGLVFIMNARYLLLSAAALDIGRRAGVGPLGRVLLALGVVEESYALQSAWARTSTLSAAGLLTIPATLMVLWTGSTYVGTAAGARFPDLEPLGLDYALPGIFVGLLGIFATDRARLKAGLSALAAGALLAVTGFTIVAILLVPPLVAVVFAWTAHAKKETRTGGAT